MTPSFSAEKIEAVFTKLSRANAAWAKTYPGESTQRQPIHTVYGGANLFKPDTIPKLGRLATSAWTQYAPDAARLAEILGQPNSDVLQTVHHRVLEKLQREAVEDFRIDFEDGFGSRSDAEEDACAVQSAQALAIGMAQHTISPYIGLRVKSLSEELKARSVRTLDLFMSTLLAATQGSLPKQFVVTLPKITVPEQVAVLAELLTEIERTHGLHEGVISIELMVESPSVLMSEQGVCLLPALLKAAQGRCVAAHLGPHDYLSACGVTAIDQHLAHPTCDFARTVMQNNFAGTGLWLSDGPTSIMPVGPHRVGEDIHLSDQQWAENNAAVHAAWRLSAKHIRNALRHGFYQGWDLHPAQIPIRYAVCYLFFLEALPEATARLRHFIERATQATLVGSQFDDAATVQGLLNYFLRALNCGAISEAEVLATGLAIDELQGRSFGQIMDRRRGTI